MRMLWIDQCYIAHYIDYTICFVFYLSAKKLLVEE
jgi:hypothetical protein